MTPKEVQQFVKSFEPSPNILELVDNLSPTNMQTSLVGLTGSEIQQVYGNLMFDLLRETEKCDAINDKASVVDLVTGSSFLAFGFMAAFLGQASLFFITLQSLSVLFGTLTFSLSLHVRQVKHFQPLRTEHVKLQEQLRGTQGTPAKNFLFRNKVIPNLWELVDSVRSFNVTKNKRLQASLVFLAGSLAFMFASMVVFILP